MALFAYLPVSKPVGNPARGMRIDIDVIRRATGGRRADARNTPGSAVYKARHRKPLQKEERC